MGINYKKRKRYSFSLYENNTKLISCPSLYYTKKILVNTSMCDINSNILFQLKFFGTLYNMLNAWQSIMNDFELNRMYFLL